MKKLRVYLDTSVICFLFADDAPEKREITRYFFARHLARYDAVVSEIVLFELQKTSDPSKRAVLANVVQEHPITVLDIAESKQREIETLADTYLRHRVFPRTKREDALHVAVCTVCACDALVTWNYRHLANIKKQVLVNHINKECGYLKDLHLLTPYEMIDESKS